ncbi:type I-C CRISPR-associated protein Cas8c/Csd1 [uncultured Phascolarctobacterium sp.]|uniref:type I-C CRISPR-associated protein Cas8c/Csd1 n=1 Tax=uncultured Phascolarctobacterium sp. TaxID=512296 RepID=UPI0026352BF8|nr:type I-C CRISPR-associated protein Cas8c/Csd1 [uncultured Phascolarctobacterium sp.]
MILQALVDYYEALAAQGRVAKPGWGIAKISYALNLDKQGRLLNLISLKLTKQKGKKAVAVPQNILLPEATKRTAGVSAQFLWDNAKYVLGLDASGKAERSKQCFEAMAQKCQEILAAAVGEKATALKAFFASWQPEAAHDNALLQPYMEDLLSSANLMFKVEGESVEQDEEIRKAWDAYKSQQASDTAQGICLVTGKKAPVARLHPNIKGLYGAQSSGAALVAFNALAYESYEHKQGDNAPVSEYAAFAYTTALNTLLASERNYLRIGEMTVVFWAEGADKDNEDVFGDIFSSENKIIEDADLQGFFEKVSQGQAFSVKDYLVKPGNKFYILGLSPNAARISVRFFFADTFGDFIKNYEQYFREFEIIKPSFDNRVNVPLWQILQETANKNSKDKAASPLLAGAVLRSILSGIKYPEALYQNTILRTKADQDNPDKNITKISRIKAAIIKACLLRNYKNNEEVVTVALNEECKKVPYVLGRLFAVLEDLQEKANPGINSTIKDRYFNSACATPSVTFPLLTKLANTHLKKISAQRGTVIYFEKLIGELMNKLEVENNAMPARLSLPEQGEFVLGYYHQVQKRFEKREEK